MISLLSDAVNALTCHGSFLNLVQRVTQKNYQPSSEDISRTVMEDQDVRNVMIPRKAAGRRFCYRFIDTVESSASGDTWIDASEDISLVVQVVDIADFDVTNFGNTSAHDAQRDVVLFKQICSSRWLAKTPLLVLLSNADSMIDKLEGQSLHHQSAHNSREGPDATSAKSFLRALFLDAETKYNTKVWIEFVGSGANAEIGKQVVRNIDKILTEESFIMHGIR